MSDPRLDPPPGAWARALTALARRLLPLRGGAPRPDEIRRVLVVRTDDRVGNALLTVPLARGLQRALPHARIDLLLAAKRARVADGLPHLRVVPFEKTDLFRRPHRFFSLLRELRRARYDVVVDAAHWHAFSVTSALLSRWAAHRWLVGPERGPSALYSAAVPPPPAGVAETDAKVALAQGLGLSVTPPPLETALGRGPSPLPRPYVALNPGARKADHRWPPDRFGALAAALRQRLGLRSFVLWGPGEERLAQEVVDRSSGAAELAPPTDLDQLASVFRGASLVVTNDTGPMHLAVACGAKVLALLLDEAGLRWTHPGPRFQAVVAPGDVQPVLTAAERLLDRAVPASEPARSPEGAA